MDKLKRSIEDDLYRMKNRHSVNIQEKPKQQLPDARLHQTISFIKSGIRIVGYAFLPFDMVAAAMILVASEVVGIVEELV